MKEPNIIRLTNKSNELFRSPVEFYIDVNKIIAFLCNKDFLTISVITMGGKQPFDISFSTDLDFESAKEELIKAWLGDKSESNVS